MVMQAWGNYGTAWPVIHQQLGVRPYLGVGGLEIVPQVPDGQPSVAGLEHPPRPRRGGRARLALGGDLHDDGSTFRPVGLRALRDRPHAAARREGRERPARRPQGHGTTRRRETNRGVEVTVPVRGSGPHTLTMTTS